MLRIAAVAPDSLASELGLRPGDELLSINERELVDFLDWEFLAADDAFVLGVRTARGAAVEFDIERPEGLPLGVTLEPPKIRRCANRCDFCFVDGNPQQARQTLFIRDDDYRLSFRHGNFATLSNLKDKDVRRIIEYRLSPLYVSVHATDTAVRRAVLRNPKAPPILDQLRMYASHGIDFHTQIVMVPGLNDGAVLEQSLRDLWDLGGSVLSVSVVPVALTSFSRHELVRSPGEAEARAAVATVHRWQERARSERDFGWVYGSDELYMVARQPFPPADAYDGFAQSENGVGAVRYLESLIEAGLDTLPDMAGQRVLVCTGAAMKDLLPLVFPALARATSAAFELVWIENSYFGPSVTSAGLLPGADFKAALADRAGYDLVLLPAESVNEDSIFVDDMPYAELEAATPMPIRLSYHFTDALAVALV